MDVTINIWPVCVSHMLHCDVASDHTTLLKAINEAQAHVPFCTIELFCCYIEIYQGVSNSLFPESLIHFYV